MEGKLPKNLMEDSYPDPVPLHPDDVEVQPISSEKPAEVTPPAPSFKSEKTPEC